MSERIERRRVTINEQSYRVIGKVKNRSIRAKVYDDGTPSANQDPMVEIREPTVKWLGLRDIDSHRQLPEIMQDALTEAVEEVENERLESEEIDERVKNVKETYE